MSNDLFPTFQVGNIKTSTIQGYPINYKLERHETIDIRRSGQIKKENGDKQVLEIAKTN